MIAVGRRSLSPPSALKPDARPLVKFENKMVPRNGKRVLHLDRLKEK